jgi:hypothetical protein
MPEKPTTNQEIDALIDLVHKSDAYTDAEKYQAIKYFESARPKADAPTLATKEEIDRVMADMDPSFRPEPKPEAAKSEEEKQADKLLNDIVSWM